MGWKTRIADCAYGMRAPEQLFVLLLLSDVGSEFSHGKLSVQARVSHASGTILATCAFYNKITKQPGFPSGKLTVRACESHAFDTFLSRMHLSAKENLNGKRWQILKEKKRFFDQKTQNCQKASHFSSAIVILLNFLGHRACQCHFLILSHCPQVMSSFETWPSVEADWTTVKSKQAFRVVGK